jgi:hypothetical protein
MPQPRVEVLGAYQLSASPELFAEAMKIKFPFQFDSDQHRKDAERHVRLELDGAVLLEVVVLDRDSTFSVDDFGQNGSDQAAYGEVFLSQDGKSVISDFDMPGDGPLRMAFFLHFADPALPLRSSYGSVAIPQVLPMSARLQSLVPYEPVT